VILFLDHFELETKFLATANCRQIKLPKFAGKTKAGPALVEVSEELKPEGAPQIRQAHMTVNRLQHYVGIERKWCAVRHEAVKRVAIKVVTMGRVGGPVGIGVVWRKNLYSTA